MFVRLSTVILASAVYAAGACESLSTFKLDNATITSAQLVAAGAFSLPGGRAGKGRGPNPYEKLPAFCRV